METGENWENLESKKILSVSETGEDWQQGQQHTVPPESHPSDLFKERKRRF